MPRPIFALLRRLRNFLLVVCSANAGLMCACSVGHGLCQAITTESRALPSVVPQTLPSFEGARLQPCRKPSRRSRALAPARTPSAVSYHDPETKGNRWPEKSSSPRMLHLLLQPTARQSAQPAWYSSQAQDLTIRQRATSSATKSRNKPGNV